MKKIPAKPFSKKQQPASHTFFSRGLISLVLAFTCTLVVLGTTFAWFHSSDTLVNAFSGTQLAAEIDEVFTPNQQWQPGETTTKEVRIKNTGQTPAYVRVSLYEFLATLQVDTNDQTGHGNLRTVGSAITPALNPADTDTWSAAATAHGTYTKAAHHYVVDSARVPNPANKTGMYEYKGTDRDKTPLTYLSLDFSTALKDSPPTALGSYWFYENGYFYYLTPLQPGQESEPLLKQVRLSPTLPNQYKGSLYKLKIYLDAHDLTKPLLSEWQLETTGPVYKLLKDQLK